MKTKRLIALLLTVLLLTTALATAQAGTVTPVIDGVIGKDWLPAWLVYDDELGESPWGPDNDMDNLYVTWDNTYLYVGVRYRVSGNGMIVYIDAGRPGGETDFNSTRGYTGGWARNITFPASHDIDMILPRWDNNGTPQAWTVVDNSATEVTSGVVAAATNVGAATDVEYAVPFELLQPGGQFCLVATIVGGDNWNGPDAAPTNASMNGGGGPSLLDNLYCFPDPASISLTGAQTAVASPSMAPVLIALAALLAVAGLQLRRR